MPRALASLGALVLLLAGCAGIPEDVRRLDPAAVAPELDDTPFYPQERYQCGPAALATVLDASGIEVSPEQLVDQVYVPERQGSFQVELLAATRRAGRIPYRIDGTLTALAAELAEGRPVLVMQNLGVSWYPRWHYAVAVGVDPTDETVILRSGTDRRRITRLKPFLHTWQRSGYWGFVALEPGALPAMVEPDRYLRAVTDFEAAGGGDAALPAWQAAIQSWPWSALAWFGLANHQLAAGRNADAEDAYLQAIAADPALWAAHNNLAFALHRQGRDDEAVALLREALANVTDDRARAEIGDSLREIEDR
ncbi:MAG: PA2778 family cysteine peptidase [Woeseiaceae bacterium]